MLMMCKKRGRRFPTPIVHREVNGYVPDRALFAHLPELQKESKHYVTHKVIKCIY